MADTGTAEKLRRGAKGPSTDDDVRWLVGLASVLARATCVDDVRRHHSDRRGETR